MSGRCLLLLTVLAGGACAQDLLTESDCSTLSELLPQVRGPRLEAYVDAVWPRLGFAFRFQAGYSIAIPLRQFTGISDSIRVLARVTPSTRSGPPVCFVQIAPLGPDIPPGLRHDFVVNGGFFLGEGKYQVDLAVVDRSARLFRKRFALTAAPRGRERHVQLKLEPGVVQPIQKLGWTPPARSGSGARRRLTVLFHAASLYGPRIYLEVPDQMLLLGSLSTVLSECSFDEIRLIAFNLDQQREIFRQDRFDVDGFRKLAETLLALKLYAVPSGALKPKAQNLEMLGSLARVEISASPPADTILFLGPYVRDDSKWKDLPCGSSHGGPRFLYFEYRVDTALVGWGTDPIAVGNVTAEGLKVEVPVRPLENPDTLERLVRACSGETARIHNPAELAAAIAKLNGPGEAQTEHVQ